MGELDQRYLSPISCDAGGTTSPAAGAAVGHINHELLVTSSLQVHKRARSGDVHLDDLGGDALVAVILILRISAWKHAMRAMNRCVAYIDGAHGKTRAMSTLKGNGPSPFRMPHDGSS